MSSEPIEPRSSLAPAWEARLRALTPARVGLGRAGVSLETAELLDFQRCHAMARDAVHGRLEFRTLAAEISALGGNEVLQLHSAAADRVRYLQRPDLGRRLDDASRAKLAEYAKSGEIAAEEDQRPLVSIALADGLSALAVERNATGLLAALLPRLTAWRIAPICIVEQSRVAIGDEIGAAFGAHLSIVLIGERPGLSSPDSLGAYITFDPKPGRTDAERNCISNIRDGGLLHTQAATQLVYYLTEAWQRKLTGVTIKEAAPLLLEDTSQ